MPMVAHVQPLHGSVVPLVLQRHGNSAQLVVQHLGRTATKAMAEATTQVRQQEVPHRGPEVEVVVLPVDPLHGSSNSSNQHQAMDMVLQAMAMVATMLPHHLHQLMSLHHLHQATSHHHLLLHRLAIEWTRDDLRHYGIWKL